MSRVLGDVRLEACSAWTSGLLYARRGEHEAAVAACRHALELSRDPFDEAWAQAYLGQAYAEHDMPREAAALLEQSVKQFAGFGAFRHHEALFSAWLSEAYLAEGRLAEAEEAATRALTLAEAAKYQVAVASAERALGGVLRVRGDREAAYERLCRATETFRSIDARFLQAQTQLLLAGVAEDVGKRVEAETNLRDAFAQFRATQVPRYEALAGTLARKLGFALC
jgi:tetratricopeptide (TPR) repeat protein